MSLFEVSTNHGPLAETSQYKDCNTFGLILGPKTDANPHAALKGLRKVEVGREEITKFKFSKS